MAERIRAINPDCQVHARQEFFLQSNAEHILSERFDCVFDAIDRVPTKCLLIALCRARGVPIVTTGGAGGRRDPTAIEVTDLAFTSHDRLLAQVRTQLRSEHGFPRGDMAFGVDCVHSREPQVFAQKDGTVQCERGDASDFRIDCSTGFGTASFVTGAFGFVAASRIVQKLVGDRCPSVSPHATAQPCSRRGNEVEASEP